MITKRVLLGVRRRASLSAPGPPTGLIATPGDAQATLTWTAPTVNGGASITDYVVEKSLAGAGSWTTFTDAVTASTGATVTGLTNLTAYDFRVRAVNAAGTGAPSAVASATPTSGAFHPETSVTTGTLKGWWDASVLASADGTALASYPNLVADGLWPLEQATAGLRMVVKTGIQNGLRVLRSDGTQWMATGTLASRVTGPHLTVFDVVIRRAFVTNGALMSLSKATDGLDYASTNGPVICYESTAAQQQNWMAGGVKATIASHPGNDIPFITTAWWDGTNSRMERRASGATIASSPVAQSPTFNIEIARMFKRGGSAEVARYDHCERLIYQGALSSGDRAAVMTYLQTKWGIG